MRRGPLVIAAVLVVLGFLLSAVTNWATEIVPAPEWLKNPLVIGLVTLVLVLLVVVFGFLTERQIPPTAAPGATPLAAPVAAAVAPSLRPPPPGPVFGRDDELAELRAPHREPVLDVVCAGGGTGKTTLARELARQHGDRAFWIDWRNDPEVLATSMTEVATTLGLGAEKVAEAQRGGRSLPDLVWTHLESVRGWLVVVDNVDDVDPLQSSANRISTYRGWLRPTSAGQLLITTRIQDAELWGPQARLHRIGRLPTPAAAAVLRDLAPHGGDAAEELAERLGGHSLALRAAGRAVGAPTSAWPTFAAYLAALREQRISVLPDAPQETDPETARRLVGHTWEVSLDQLAARPATRLARPLLRALSLLARAPIPRGLVTPALLPDGATEQQVDDALAGLDRFGLLEPTAPGTVLLHPLVRETSAAFLAKEADVEQWRMRVEDRVVAFVEETAARQKDGWQDARLLVPHVLGLSGFAVRPDPDADDAGRRREAVGAAETAADQLAAAGAYPAELELRQRVLDADTRHHGPGSGDVLISGVTLGMTLLRLREYAAAERQFRSALADADGQHPDIVRSIRAGLAGALLNSGDIAGAVDLLEELLAEETARSGPDDPQTITVSHNLAQALSQRGDHERATAIFRHNLSVEVDEQGADHPTTMSTVNELAGTLHKMGRVEEAEQLNAQNLARRERVLGEDHPDTLVSRHNLARDRLALGEYRGAVALARQAHEAHERVLGPDHYGTTRSRDLLTDCERALAAASPLGRLRARLRRPARTQVSGSAPRS